MQPAESVTTYAARAMSLADELQAAGEPLSNKQLVLNMLSGLPKSYDITVDTLMAAGGDLDFSEVVSRLMLVEDRARESSEPSAPGAAAYYTAVKRTGKSECWYCGKRGHEKKDCRKRKKDLQKQLEDEEGYAGMALAGSSHSDWPFDFVAY